MNKFITKEAIARRSNWIEEIRRLKGDFGENVVSIEQKLANEVAQEGKQVLIEHLRLCGNIPEYYNHDSSEEKLYAKYTDHLISEVFKSFGLRSLILKERSDAADVEVFAKSYEFVADAKSFRLSRTAKNQKDFKVDAMDRWRRNKDYAMIVCPIYQLPVRTSQIYQQATTKNVCIFTYSHLAMLISFSMFDDNKKIEELLHQIFKKILVLNPSKDAFSYWIAINTTILEFDQEMEKLWKQEKEAALESMKAAKEESLTFLMQERAKIMKMTHEEALQELLIVHKIENKITAINSVTNNTIFEIRN